MARVYRRGCRYPLRPASMHRLRARGFRHSFRELRRSRYPNGNRRSSLLGARTPGPTSYCRRYGPITRRPVTREHSGPPCPLAASPLNTTRSPPSKKLPTNTPFGFGPTCAKSWLGVR